MKDLQTAQKPRASSPCSAPGSTLPSSLPLLTFSASDGEKVDEVRMRCLATVEAKAERPVASPALPHGKR
jgi:hypothetical protein